MNALQWVINFVPVILLLFLAWISKKQFRSWLAPSAFFCLYWFGSLLIVLFFASDFYFWPGATWLILFYGYSFYLGMYIGAASKKNISNNFINYSDKNEFELVMKYGKLIILSSVIIGLISSILLVYYAGFRLETLVRSPSEILEVGRSYSSLRYIEGRGPNQIIIILNIALYVGQLFAGAWYAAYSYRSIKFLALLPLSVGLLQSFLINARTGFIWMFILFIGSYLSILTLQNKHTKFLTIHRILTTASLIVFFATFYFIIQVVRENSTDAVRNSFVKSRVSMLTSPVLFSIWLENNYYDLELAVGTKSFGGLTDLFGISQTEQGLGWEGISVQTEIGELLPNVYTAFRQIIEDFSVPGSIIFFLVVGILSGVAYRNVENGQVKWLPVLMLFYSVTLGSYVANWMAYTTLILAWMFFLLLMISPIGGILIRRRVAKRN